MNGCVRDVKITGYVGERWKRNACSDVLVHN